MVTLNIFRDLVKYHRDSLHSFCCSDGRQIAEIKRQCLEKDEDIEQLKMLSLG
jgi:hypothetical protein